MSEHQSSQAHMNGSTTGFRAEVTRPVRLRRLPDPESAEFEPIEIEPAPEVPTADPTPLLPKLMPIVMVIGVLGSVIWMARSGGRMSPMMLMFPIMMLASAGTMISSSLGGGNTKQEMMRRRREYIRYLAELEDERNELQQLFRKEEEERFPHGARYRSVFDHRYFWAIREDDDSFLCLRIASGPRATEEKYIFPELPREEELEPISVAALHLFSQQANMLSDMPIVFSMKGFGRVAVTGDEEKSRALFRSMVMTFLLTHHPEDCHVILACEDPEWLELMKWAPHVVRQEAADLYPVNLLDNVFDMRAVVPATGTTVLITDSAEFLEARGPYFNNVIAFLPHEEDDEQGMWLHVDEENVLTASFEGEYSVVGYAEQLSHADATAAAHQLAGLSVAAKGDTAAAGDDEETAKEDLFTLLGMGEVDNFLADRDWSLKVGRDRLRIPFGLDDEGKPVYLDFKESAQGGVGPHGLCIGATGSGKSELLRTLVAGLLASHSPDQVNLVLIDFKGGATFSGIAGAPHVAAVITNLSDDALAVERMYAALEGELRRRQEILHAAGGYANIDEYNKARSRGLVDVEKYPHLPALLIIVDEFSELLSERPDFADLFVQIGRLGRSLHVHLLLASQRIDAGKLRGLESHLSYRIALKTFSAAESRSVIGVAAAYELPQMPGVGYLCGGGEELQKFRAFYVSGAVEKRVHRRDRDELEVYDKEDRFLEFYGVSPLRAGTYGYSIEVREEQPEVTIEAAEEEHPVEEDSEERTIFHTLLNKFPANLPRAHQVWLPPLPEQISVTEAAQLLAVSTSGVMEVDELSQQGVVGLVDVPAQQMRKAMRVSLSSVEHSLVVGTTQSGKSEALVTIASALCQENSPENLKLYAVDAGGGVLSHLRILPHCASVCSTSDTERLERTFAEVGQELRGRADGELPIEQHIVLMIDGWAALVENDMEIEEKVRQIAREGLSYNIHLVVSAQRWADVRAALRDSLTTRWELRLGDTADSMMGRRNAEKVPKMPGRGITETGLHFLFALQNQAGLLQIAERWESVPPVQPLALLPRVADLAELEPITRSGHGYRVPLGIEGNTLGNYVFDTGQKENLLVIGDGSGKSTLLRTFVQRLTKVAEPKDAKFLIVDYRRQLLGACPQSHLAGYASTKQEVMSFAGQLKKALEDRLPSGVIDPVQLQNRSWWEGPDVYLVVDDYDLVASSSGNPLLDLVELLPYGRDIGLHVIVARRCTGFSRASFEPFLTRLRELHPTTLLMNGSKEEGAILNGRKARPLPVGRADTVNENGEHMVVQIAYPIDKKDDAQ
ncbi:MAG: type VII secretion protein EccCa [Lawsonella sp.]